MNRLTGLTRVAFVTALAAAGYNASAAVLLDRSLDLEVNYEIIPPPRPGRGETDPYTHFPYRLFLPPGYEENGDKFPLVLFLHGSGERGTDNLAQVSTHIDGLIEATQSDAFAAYLLAPQLPLTLNDPRNPNENPDLPQTSNELFKDILDAVLETYPVDTNRLYVTGLSLGGFGTFGMISEYPDLFAAAVPLSGGGDPAAADIIKDIPLWIFHGRTDETVPFIYSQTMFDAVTEAGGSPMLTEIPAEGHGGWDLIYRDESNELYPWMFNQRIPEPATLCLLGGLLGAAGYRRAARG